MKLSFVENLGLFLLELFEPLRFFKHRRERLRQERDEEREFQLEMLSTILGKVEQIVEHHKEQGVAQAQASERLAQAIGIWLEMFKNANASSEHLSSETVRPGDEREAELQRERERLIKKGLPINGSQAEQLAWLIDNDELASI